MESITTQLYTSVQSYWRRRSYRRLEAGLPRLPSKTNTKKRVLKLGRGNRNKTKTNHRTWKVGIILKTVFRFRPKKFLSKLRDAYVDSLLALSGREGLPSAGRKGGKVEAVWGKRVPKARTLSVKGGEMDFETKMMLHIYSNMLLSATPRQLTSAY